MEYGTIYRDSRHISSLGLNGDSILDDEFIFQKDKRNRTTKRREIIRFLVFA